MKKPDPINTVKHQDEFSSGLMEQFGKWMGGDCFQNTEMPDLHLSEAPFDGMDPQSNGAEIEDTTKKKKSAKKGAYVGQESAKSEEVLEREEYEIDGEVYVLEKVKMDGVDDNGSTSCWKGYKKQGTKKKGGKEVNNCVKAGDEVTHDGEELEEKNGLYANIHAKRKRGGSMRDKGDKGAPTEKAFKDSAKTAKESVELDEYFEKNKEGKMVKKHNCAKKVKKEDREYFCLPEQHTMLEDGTVTHYDLVSEKGEVLRNVPVTELEILISEMHEHADNHAKNAALLGEKKLDPVGKADADIDNDGDVDQSDKFLHARRKKVSKIIAMGKKKK